jgi:hypothetical protein
MADDRGLLVEALDDLVEVVGDLADRLMGEGLGVLFGLGDGVGVVGPARGQRHVTGPFEDRGPAVPAVRQEPEPVDEDDRLFPRRVCFLDLLRLVLGDRRCCHARSPSFGLGLYRSGPIRGSDPRRHLPRFAGICVGRLKKFQWRLKDSAARGQSLSPATDHRPRRPRRPAGGRCRRPRDHRRHHLLPPAQGGRPLGRRRPLRKPLRPDRGGIRRGHPQRRDEARIRGPFTQLPGGKGLKAPALKSAPRPPTARSPPTANCSCPRSRSSCPKPNRPTPAGAGRLSLVSGHSAYQVEFRMNP